MRNFTWNRFPIKNLLIDSLLTPYCMVIHFLCFCEWRYSCGEDDRWARIRTGSAGSGLKPILAGSGLVRTAIFLKIGGSGLDRTEKILVILMWIFWKYQKFCCDPISQVCQMVVYILPSNAKTLLELFCNSNCIHLSSHITLNSSSNVNIVGG